MPWSTPRIRQMHVDCRAARFVSFMSTIFHCGISWMCLYMRGPCLTLARRLSGDPGRHSRTTSHAHKPAAVNTLSRAQKPGDIR